MVSFPAALAGHPWCLFRQHLQDTHVADAHLQDTHSGSPFQDTHVGVPSAGRRGPGLLPPRTGRDIRVGAVGAHCARALQDHALDLRPLFEDAIQVRDDVRRKSTGLPGRGVFTHAPRCRSCAGGTAEIVFGNGSGPGRRSPRRHSPGRCGPSGCGSGSFPSGLRRHRSIPGKSKWTPVLWISGCQV